MVTKLLARFFARPKVAAYIIRRAQRTPYMHLDGYMGRWWLFNPTPPLNDGRGKKWNWLPSIRIHHILREDADRHKHDHPWNARTFILRGWYEEERIVRYPDPEPYPDMDPIERFRRNAGDTAALKFGEYHSITRVSEGGVWTMFVMYRYQGTWGFLVNDVKVPWREYLAAKETQP